MDETDSLLVRDSATRLYGVFRVTGEKLMPCEHGALFEQKFVYFEAIEEDGLNNHTLLDETGRVVIGYEYAAYELISPRWCAAVMLEAAEGEVYDYSGGFLGGGHRYLATRYDIYDLSAGAKVGSFTRDRYDRCVALGGFLYVEDKNDKTTAYDATLTALTGEIQCMSAPLDTMDGKCVNLANGEVALENCTNVSVSNDTEHFRAWRNDMVGLYDAEGKELIPAEYESIGVEYDSCAPVKQNGLADWHGNVMLPLEYKSYDIEITDNANAVAVGDTVYAVKRGE